jgi:hypothetical protein
MTITVVRLALRAFFSAPSSFSMPETLLDSAPSEAA